MSGLGIAGRLREGRAGEAARQQDQAAHQPTSKAARLIGFAP